MIDSNAIADVQARVRRRLLRYCARQPFALDRLRELDPEHLVYDALKPGPGGSSPRCLTPLERLARSMKPFRSCARSAGPWEPDASLPGQRVRGGLVVFVGAMISASRRRAAWYSDGSCA